MIIYTKLLLKLIVIGSKKILASVFIFTVKHERERERERERECVSDGFNAPPDYDLFLFLI